MTRRLTGNITKGRPGYKRGGSISRYTGNFVSKTKASGAGVRRLFAQDPADGKTTNIGTKRDALRFTNNPKIPNVTAAPSPRKVRGPNFIKGNRVASGQKRVVKRINRAVRKLK